jgi:hypothetical protein
MAEFIEVARGTLELYGVPFDKGDLQVLAMIGAAFEPAMRALDDADIRELPLEADLDPRRPPRRPAT